VGIRAAGDTFVQYASTITVEDNKTLTGMEWTTPDTKTFPTNYGSQISITTPLHPSKGPFLIRLVSSSNKESVRQKHLEVFIHPESASVVVVANLRNNEVHRKEFRLPPMEGESFNEILTSLRLLNDRFDVSFNYLGTNFNDSISYAVKAEYAKLRPLRQIFASCDDPSPCGFLMEAKGFFVPQEAGYSYHDSVPVTSPIITAGIVISTAIACFVVALAGLYTFYNKIVDEASELDLDNIYAAETMKNTTFSNIS